MMNPKTMWIAVVGASLALVPACVDDEAAVPDDFESVGDVELEGEPRVLVGEEAIAFQEAATSGAAMAAGLVTDCTVVFVTTPASGRATWASCIRSDKLMWMSLAAAAPLSWSYQQLAVAGINVTTGFRSWPKIVAAPNNANAVVVLDARGMSVPGNRFAASTAVKAVNQPWSWPLISPQQTW